MIMVDEKRVQNLLKGLTSRQIADLLMQLLNAMSEEERKQFADGLEADVAEVFKTAIVSPERTEKTEESPTTDDKFMQEFRGVVGDIHGLIMEVGDEEGEYILQEHHWEPPSFDPYKLADDIDECAQKLLPMLERAAGTGKEDENLFMDMCEAVSETIDYYPDYIYTEEGVFFNQVATECVIVWLELHSETKTQFLNKIIEFINADHCVTLDENAIKKVLVGQRPAGKRRDFYQAIGVRIDSDELFREQTQTAHTLWHNVNYDLAKEFDPEKRIAIAEESVSNDWRKGVELVEAAVAEDNIERALDFCYKTVNAYYQRGSLIDSDSEFDLQTTPIFNFYPDTDSETIISKLFGQWAKLADRKGQTQRAELLRIHQVLNTNPGDWTDVKRVFQEAGEAETSMLFSAWREYTLKHQTGSYFFNSTPKKPTWPAWLLEAGWADEFHVFTEKALSWLDKTVPKKGLRKLDNRNRIHTPTENELLPPQLSLVADLLALGAHAQYEALASMLDKECALQDSQARREWLRKTDTDKLTVAGLKFIQRNILSFIPSPENMSPNYELAAGWFAAAREIAPQAACSVLKSWQVEHKRKRNLWRDLRTQGFNV